jgi:allantoin racemase
MPRILVIVPFALDERGVARRREQLKAVPLDPASEFHFRPVTAG